MYRNGFRSQCEHLTSKTSGKVDILDIKAALDVGPNETQHEGFSDIEQHNTLEGVAKQARPAHLPKVTKHVTKKI